jgi:hypothetical protein
MQFVECLPNFSSGHVFAFGESRALAIANMVLGLKEIQIRGEIRTNVDYTINLLHVNSSPALHPFLLTVPFFTEFDKKVASEKQTDID